MKALGLALIAAVAIGCSASPTSPTSTSLDPVATLASQDSKPAHSPGTQKVEIYFYDPDMEFGGNVHIIGLPVHLDSASITTPVTAYSGKQGSVSIDVPKTDTWVHYVTDQYKEWCSTSGTILLPYGVRENWVMLPEGCGPGM